MNIFRPSDRRPVNGRTASVASPDTFCLDKDFPDLVSSNTNTNHTNQTNQTNQTNPLPTSKPIDSSLKFSRIVDKQPVNTAVAVVDEVLPPGVVQYTLNKRTNTLTMLEREPKPDAQDKEANLSYYRFTKMHATLQQNYCDHADHFIQCYGYDCYERTFLMPNYDNSYFSDDSDWSSDSDESE